MFKSTHFRLLIGGLVILLSACTSAAAGQSAPVKEAAPAEVVTVPEAQVEEEPLEAAAPASEPVAGPAAEVEVAEEPVTEEAMAKLEETAPVVKEDVAPVEAASVEADTMKQEANQTHASPTAAQLQLLATLENRGMPPELFNEVWLNSMPLKLADLHGKVVIVEFWTFGCINCKNVVPSLREWHHKYKDEGLVIIGVHTPEFGYERELANVEQALIDQDIPYSVAIDNDWKTWRAYNNRYWPAKYFIDKAGSLRHIHIGEGRYEQQEEIIQALLAEELS